VLTESKDTTTSMASFQEGVELLLSLTTIQQLAWSTKQQHVGRSLTIEFFGSNVLIGVLGQLLLDDTLIVKLQEQSEHIGRSNQIGSDLVNLKIDGAAVCKK